MEMLRLSKDIIEKLEIIEGVNLEEKVIKLLKGGVSSQLKECADFILGYETKYAMTFEQFKDAWERDEIHNKHSHEVERDFMEWEGFELERDKWLKLLRDLKTPN